MEQVEMPQRSITRYLMLVVLAIVLAIDLPVLVAWVRGAPEAVPHRYVDKLGNVLVVLGLTGSMWFEPRSVTAPRRHRWLSHAFLLVALAGIAIQFSTARL